MNRPVARSRDLALRPAAASTAPAVPWFADVSSITLSLAPHDQIQIGIHRGRPPGRHHGGGIELFDDGGAGELRPDRKPRGGARRGLAKLGNLIVGGLFILQVVLVIAGVLIWILAD